MRCNGVLIVMICLISCVDSNKQKQIDLKKLGLQQIHVGEVDLLAKVMPAGNIDNFKQGDENLVYFNVKLARTSDRKFEKEQMLYLNFDMHQDFSLKIGQQEILPSICQKIENGRANTYEYIMAFELGKATSKVQDISLLYKDKIFGIGTVAFVYAPSDIGSLDPKS